MLTLSVQIRDSMLEICSYYHLDQGKSFILANGLHEAAYWHRLSKSFKLILPTAPKMKLVATMW
jgi:hypothetical protein